MVATKFKGDIETTGTGFLKTTRLRSATGNPITIAFFDNTTGELMRNTSTGFDATNIVATYSPTNYSVGGGGSTLLGQLQGIDSALAATVGGMHFEGSVDYAGAGTGSFPGGGTAAVGDYYVVTNAAAGGTVLGSSNQITVHSGDKLIATTLNASTTNGAQWTKVDTTDSVSSVNGEIGAVVLDDQDIGSAFSAVNFTAGAATVRGMVSGIDTALGLRSLTSHVHAASAITSGTFATALFGATTIPGSALQNNAVGNAQFRQSVAVSVVGVTGGSTANVADIVAAADGAVLRRTSSSALAFGTLVATSFADNTIAYSRLVQATGPVFLGVQTGLANVTALSKATALTMLNVADGATVGLAGANQVLTADRTISNGASPFSLFINLTDTTKTSSVLFDPTPTSMVFTNNDATSSTVVTFGATNVDFTFTGTADFSLGGSPGTADQYFGSNGNNAAPTWKTLPVSPAYVQNFLIAAWVDASGTATLTITAATHGKAVGTTYKVVGGVEVYQVDGSNTTKVYVPTHTVSANGNVVLTIPTVDAFDGVVVIT